MSWIQTASSRKVDPLNMSADDVDITDIAHSLACLNRFTGHTPEPYNVAQHSVIVSLLCPKKYRLWGLLHDASEAYTNDISRPFKSALNAMTGDLIKTIETNIMFAVCNKFGLDTTEPKEVKEADNLALAMEAKSFFGHTEFYKQWDCYGTKLPTEEPIIPMAWDKSERLFLRHYHWIIGDSKCQTTEGRLANEQVQVARKYLTLRLAR